jgi:hypothetical protein
MSFGKHARVDKARAAIEDCQKELERAEVAIAGIRAPTQYEKTREIARLIRQEMAADESSSFKGPPARPASSPPDLSPLTRLAALVCERGPFHWGRADRESHREALGAPKPAPAALSSTQPPDSALKRPPPVEKQLQLVWRVLEPCGVRARLELGSTPRQRLSQGDEVVELDRATVEEELQLRVEAGWICAENLDRVGGVEEAGRLARMQEMFTEVEEQEAEHRRFLRARQLLAWGTAVLGCNGAPAALPAAVLRAVGRRVLEQEEPDAELGKRQAKQEADSQQDAEATRKEDVRVSKAIQKQLGRAKKKFAQMDVDGNGVLDGDELLNLADWIFGSFHPGGERLDPEAKDLEVARLLKQLDTDGDGALDYGEFEAWFCETAEAIYRTQRQRAMEARRAAREAAEREAVEAKVRAEARRVTDREERLKQLIHDVRSELVVALGLKSSKIRPMLTELDALTSGEALAVFCKRAEVLKYLKTFDLSQISALQAAEFKLADVPMFKQLPEAELLLLAERLEQQDFEGGAVIVAEGDVNGTAMYIIEEGECAVKVLAAGPTPVAKLTEGAHFGEVALIKQEPRNATVRREALLCPMGAATL